MAHDTVKQRHKPAKTTNLCCQVTYARCIAPEINLCFQVARGHVLENLEIPVDVVMPRLFTGMSQPYTLNPKPFSPCQSLVCVCVGECVCLWVCVCMCVCVLFAERSIEYVCIATFAD